MRVRPLLTSACAAAAISWSALPVEAASTIQITKVYVNSAGDDLPPTNAMVNAE